MIKSLLILMFVIISFSSYANDDEEDDHELTWTLQVSIVDENKNQQMYFENGVFESQDICENYRYKFLMTFHSPQNFTVETNCNPND